MKMYIFRITIIVRKYYIIWYEPGAYNYWEFKVHFIIVQLSFFHCTKAVLSAVLTTFKLL